MSTFNKKDFGNNIRKFRKIKGFNQEDLAKAINKDRTLISKYESGDSLPSADDISKICDALEISEVDLFGARNKIKNEENIFNPFKSNQLYMYFNAYDYRTKKYKRNKYKLLITNRPDFIKVDFLDIDDDKIYLSGYMLSDNMCSFIIFENNKEFNRRLEVSEIIIDIDSGVDGLMLGTYMGTNSQYIPSIRKCYFSQKEVKFTDEMFEKLKTTDEEIEKLKETNALYLDIFNN